MNRKDIADLLITCLNPTQQDIQQNQLTQLEPTQWEDYQRVKQHNLTNRMPQPIYRRLHRRFRENAARNLQIYGELEPLLAALSKQDIPVIVLKGAYLARAAYSNPALRYMADYDILVHESDLPVVVDIVTTLGYQASQPVHLEGKSRLPHLPPFRKENGIADVEIHWTIVSPLDPQTIEIDALWKRAQPFRVGDAKALAFCPTDMLLHLCFHAAYDDFFVQGLRPLYDIAQLVERYGDIVGGEDGAENDEARLNWHDVCERSALWNCSRGTYLMLYLSYTLLNANIPPDVLEKLQPANTPLELIETAKRRLFANEESVDDSVSANFMRITGEKRLKDKVSLFASRLLISRLELSEAYEVPVDSPLLYLYYPRRYWDFFVNSSQQVWRYVNGTQTFKSDTDQRNLLINWMEQG